MDWALQKLGFMTGEKLYTGSQIASPIASIIVNNQTNAVIELVHVAKE